MTFSGPKAASPPKKDFWIRRLECRFIDDRHLPFVEIDADVPLDPRKAVFLSDGDQNVVRRIKYVGFAGRDEAAFAVFVVFGLDLFKGHPEERLAVAGEPSRQPGLPTAD